VNSGFLIVQSGGPTAVSNEILAAAAHEASESMAPGAPLLGVRFGLPGILREDYIDLKSITHWDAVKSAPGAALGSSRYRLKEEELDRIVDELDRIGIHFLLMIGGNGTMGAVGALAQAAAARGSKLLVGGVPDTVDNDIHGTDFCLGFPSCARYCVLTTQDVAADVRSLPTPVSIVEVMGRNAGWNAASTVLARQGADDAPHRVYLPEAPVIRESFLADVQNTFDRHGWAVFVVAEGVKTADGTPWSAPAVNPSVGGFGGAMVGGAGSVLARLVTSELGLRSRCEKPGLAARAAVHLVSTVDRECAGRAARFAAQELLQGNSGFAAVLDRRNGSPVDFSCRALPFSSMKSGERLIPPVFLSNKNGQPNEHCLEYVAPLIGSLGHHSTLLGESTWRQRQSI
jgi:ATP-dependent phosphofructokinase / diphosphate-dependent phosphofructokinase